MPAQDLIVYGRLRHSNECFSCFIPPASGTPARSLRGDSGCHRSVYLPHGAGHRLLDDNSQPDLERQRHALSRCSLLPEPATLQTLGRLETQRAPIAEKMCRSGRASSHRAAPCMHTVAASDSPTRGTVAPSLRAQLATVNARARASHCATPSPALARACRPCIDEAVVRKRRPWESFHMLEALQHRDERRPTRTKLQPKQGRSRLDRSWQARISRARPHDPCGSGPGGGARPGDLVPGLPFVRHRRRLLSSRPIRCRSSVGTIEPGPHLGRDGDGDDLRGGSDGGPTTDAFISAPSGETKQDDPRRRATIVGAVNFTTHVRSASPAG